MASSSSGNHESKSGGKSGPTVTLQPGIYVVGRSIEGNPVAALGTHQFIVLIPVVPSNFPMAKDLGNGNRGIVLGAYNMGGRLQALGNADSDSERLKKTLTGDSSSKPVEIEPVDLSKAGLSGKIDEAVSLVLAAWVSYNVNELKKPISYPDGASGQFADNCINSNSWAQSMIENTLGKGAVIEDFDGYDACNTNRIESSYFKP